MDSYLGVPFVIWSAIIASAITILGVMLTNVAQGKRQKANFDHELKKLELEQKAVLKKDILLDVAASFAKVVDVIPKLSDLNFSNNDLNNQIGEHSSLMARAYLSADEHTLATMLDFASEWYESFLSLIHPRNALLTHKQEIERYQTLIDAAHAEKDRIIAISKEFDLKGAINKKRLQYLENSYESQIKIIESNTLLQAEKRDEFQKLQTEYREKCLMEHGRLLLLLPDMVTSCRKELGSKENSAIFANALQKTVQRTNTSYEKIFRDAN